MTVDRVLELNELGLFNRKTLALTHSIPIECKYLRTIGIRTRDTIRLVPVGVIFSVPEIVCSNNCWSILSVRTARLTGLALPRVGLLRQTNI